MTANEALAAAQEVARRNGWPWEPPFTTARTRRWLLFGRHECVILSHADKLGMNVRVVIDDASGEILASAYHPR